ncbi:MAG: Glu/Leu/Phe/Val dehydrogenase [Alphaproteobacteria bacterium]|nr:Glu/Leu/Phe/Val dehydrogenase [Alphaproteobacteria bacterium]
MFSHPEYDSHERVVYVREARAGLSAIIALHSTALGPAFGGCRMWPYRDDAQALADVLRLSRGMTYKAAICELPFGGGKSVILGDSRRDKTPELLRAMGRAVESLNGRYIIADDVGTTLDDLVVMRQETSYTAAATAAAKAPLPVTAFGVFCALRAAAKHYFAQDDFKGLRVAVQGLGNVGMPLCRFLHESGARLVVCDMDQARAGRAREAFAAQDVPVDAIYDAEVDIFAPSALGGILNDQTIGRLKARLVCGGANNQLEHSRHDAALAQRGIAYIPDYLANAGGVIDFYQEAIDDRPEAVMKSVERIGRITAAVLAQAEREGARPLAVCDATVHRRLKAAR